MDKYMVKVAKRLARVAQNNARFFPRSGFKSDAEHEEALKRALEGILNVGADYYHLDKDKLREAVIKFMHATG